MAKVKARYVTLRIPTTNVTQDKADSSLPEPCRFCVYRSSVKKLLREQSVKPRRPRDRRHRKI